MALEHVNRRGDRYFVLQGLTKTGKPKYYASRKPHGIAVEELPPGFEIYEHPDTALVSVRKTKPTRILVSEREALARQIEQLTSVELFLVDIRDDSLIVYTSDINPSERFRTLEILMGPMGQFADSTADWITRHAKYIPMLRFTLVSEDPRLFALERWCFRGSVDGWIPLSRAQSLHWLTEEFLPFLGRDEFYDLV